MNSKLSKITALAVSAAFAAGFSLQLHSEMPIDASAAEVLSAADITEEMGVGWNLGNSLDSNNSGFYSDNILDYETQWSSPVVTKSLIDSVKEYGFRTVRIPITWYQHISNDGNYTIDSAWLARVKEVVDYAYNNGMYVIINVHHETWINRSDFETAEAAMETELRAVWKQIAAEFADYDQRLIFEGMNEPREVGGSADEWDGNAKCYNIINQLNAAFVDTVRSVKSPYRQTRMLMVPDYAASSKSSIYSNLIIPKALGSIDADNDGDDDYVAVSLHAYSPYSFAMGNGDHSDFSSADDYELENMFSGMQAKFLQEDIPIVIGEFSASNYGYDSARVSWAEAYMKYATEYGIPCVLWDNNVEANNGGEAHGYINRSTNTWYSSAENVGEKLISTRYGTQWGTKSHISYPMYEHSDYSSGDNISFDGQNIRVSSLNGFGSGREIAIKYDGVNAPQAALMNEAWGGWTTLSPYDYDKENNIAYFSYDQIAKAWNTSENGNLCYIQITNKNSIGFGGAALLDIPDDNDSGELKIKTQPVDVTTYDSGKAVFTVKAVGEDISYQWQFSNNGGSVWYDLLNENSNELTVTAQLSLNGYMYRCVLTGGNESVVSNAALLTVRRTSSGTHNDLGTGTDFKVEYDGAIKLNEISGFTSGKELALQFSGSVPEIALMNSDWDNWTEVSSFETDLLNNIIYLPYDALMEAWGTGKGTLAYAKITNYEAAGINGSKLLDIPVSDPKFEIIEAPDDLWIYYCQQFELSAAANADNLSHKWLISHDGGNEWEAAYTVSEKVTTGTGITRVTAVFDVYKNNMVEGETALIRCDFSNKTMGTPSAAGLIQVLSRNADVQALEIGSYSAKLSWSANPYAVSYNVYRVVNGEFAPAGNYSGTECLLSGLEANTDYEYFVSAVYSDGEAMPYIRNTVTFRTASKPVDDMTIEECIEYVNSFGTDTDILTEEQMKAVERILAYDYSK